MKAKVNSILAVIGSWILSILGIGCSSTSCAVMYGCPHTDFVLKGVVTDAESNPIQGIKVTLQEQYKDNEIQPVMETAYTDENGTASAHDSYSMIFGNTEDIVYTIRLEDVDGPENGGEFKSKTISANIVKVSDSSGAWDMGDYECTFKASLDKTNLYPSAIPRRRNSHKS
ncbi:MAG: radical SAM-associated putative lipoprotein [Bacteroidales bacterium]|nr:radical SAM-associated putative lipoprotein [Bacteroidales bacterium]